MTVNWHIQTCSDYETNLTNNRNMVSNSKNSCTRKNKNKEILIYLAVLLTFSIIIILADSVKADSSESEKLSLVDPTESYDYVIITDNTLKNSFDILAEWKTDKGVKATVITIEDITNDPDYDGTDAPEEIRNFIIDAKDNWGITYVLLGGDTNIIPYRGVYGIVNKGQSSEEEDFGIPCDMYYACLDGDWDDDADGIYGEGSVANGGSGTAGEEADLEAEVFVGRAPVDTIMEADNFVNKIIDYEKNPILDYLKNGLFLASKFDSFTDGAVTSNNIITNKIPGDFTITTLYENDVTASNIETTNQLNIGQHIVNIIGHGSPITLGLAHEDYVETYTIADVDGLTNGFRYFLIYSVGCESNSYDIDSISEHFINNNGDGAFAYIGNTRYGWYEPGSPGLGASEKLNVEFYDAIYNEDIFNLGKAFQDSKEDLIGDVGAIESMRWCYFALTLLGDPETPIWTDIPNPLEVTFKPKIFDLQQSFKVYVNDSGIPVEDAMVCISQSPDLFETTTTDSNGVAVFDINPDLGLFEISVSKQNYEVYENVITVVVYSPPGVEVTSPITQEYHCNLTIDWNAWDNGTVVEIKIEYKYEDGVWQTLVDGLDNFDAPWKWNLLDPYMNDGKYSLKVIAVDDEGNTGENYSQDFTINNPLIIINEPSGGNILQGEHNIFWGVLDFYKDINDFDIMLSSDGGNTYEILISSLVDNTRWWLWDTLTVEDGENYKIKIIGNIDLDKVENISEEFTIYNPDPPVALINVDKTNIWEDEKIFLDANDSWDPDKNPDLQYDWDFDDGNQKKGKIVSHSFKKMGYYNVTLTVTDETFLSNFTSIMIIVNNAEPIAVFKVNKTSWIEDDIIFFDASDSIDNTSDKLTLNYYWDFGDGRFGEGEKITHSYGRQGIYIVRLIVTDDDNEESRDSINIVIVNIIPEANAGSYQRANKDETIIFDASESTDTPSDKEELNYYWNFGDGDTGNGIFRTHKYRNAGRYIVSLTVTDDDGASDISSIAVDINNITVKAKILKIDGKDIGIGDQYQYIVFDASNTTKPDDAEIDYYWDFADGNLGYGKIVRHKFDKGTQGDPYNVILTIQDNDTTEEGGINYETSVEVYINWAPVAVFNINTNYTVNESILFISLSTDRNEYDLKNNNVEYLWNFGDGTTSTNKTIYHAYTSPGNYTVTLTVTDDRGLKNTKTENVEILEERVDDNGDDDDSKLFFEDFFNLLILITIILCILIIALVGIYYQKKKKVVFQRIQK